MLNQALSALFRPPGCWHMNWQKRSLFCGKRRVFERTVKSNSNRTAVCHPGRTMNFGPEHVPDGWFQPQAFLTRRAASKEAYMESEKTVLDQARSTWAI